MFRSSLVRLAALSVALIGFSGQLQAQTLGMDSGVRCETPSPTAFHREMLEEAVGVKSRVGGIVQIPVAFHVVSVGDAVSEGNVPQAWVDAQMNALNTVFFPFGYRLVRVTLDRVENPDWWNMSRGSSQEVAMKEALGRDPAAFLNIYSTRLAGDALGWSYLPGTFSADPEEDEADIRHALVVDFETLPGSNRGQYDRGDTAIHEMGHFLGLLHTFEGWTAQQPAGGCSVGDGVLDTPFEASPNFVGCDLQRDTCPALAGTDPVTNFMDFSPDLCLDTFTPGQTERMAGLFQTFKPTLARGPLTFVRETELDFGEVGVGRSETQSVRVINLGGPPITLTGIASTNAAFAPVQEQATVQAGGSVDLDIVFTPAGRGLTTGTLVLQTNNLDVGTLTVPLRGTGYAPPVLTVSPEAVSVALGPGETASRDVSLGNEGAGVLEYRVVGSALASGGPDAFGYTWQDSDAEFGPVFEAIDLSVSGGVTELPLGDDESVRVQLPFAMPFYGETHDELYVVSNGFLSFGGPTIAFENVGIPSAGEPGPFIAPYWDDLTPGPSTRILTRDLGDGRFVVQWTGIGAFETTGVITFQAILSATGDITFQYLANSLPTAGATIGIEGADGTAGLEVARDMSYARAGLAVRFTTSASWIEAVTPAAGTVVSGAETTVTVDLSSVGLAPGIYQDLIDIDTNDPDQPLLRLHAVLAVGDDLPPPALASPRYGATREAATVALRWLAVLGADRYDVQVATDMAFSDIVATEEAMSNTALFDGLFGTSYVWRVRSVGERVSPWSLPFPFTTAVFVGAESAPTWAPEGLRSAFPNPTAATVTVPFTLHAADTYITVIVYDVTGRRIATLADGVFSAGSHHVRWSTADVPPGVYVIRLSRGDRVESTRVTVLR